MMQTDQYIELQSAINQLSAEAKCVLCFNLLEINYEHIRWYSEELHQDITPLVKLRTKLHNFLIGELKSFANLQRFHDEFLEWQVTIPENDCLAYRIFNLNLSGYTTCCDNFLDKDSLDAGLFFLSHQNIFEEMDALGCDTTEYQTYLFEFTKSQIQELKDISALPVKKNLVLWDTSDQSTFFGL